MRSLKPPHMQLEIGGAVIGTRPCTEAAADYSTSFPGLSSLRNRLSRPHSRFASLPKELFDTRNFKQNEP